MTIQRQITPQITTNLSRVEASMQERQVLGYETHHKLDITLSDCRIENVVWDEVDDSVLIEFRTRDDIAHDEQHDHSFDQWRNVADLENGIHWTRACVWGDCDESETVVIPHD